MLRRKKFSNLGSRQKKRRLAYLENKVNGKQKKEQNVGHKTEHVESISKNILNLNESFQEFDYQEECSSTNGINEINSNVSFFDENAKEAFFDCSNDCSINNFEDPQTSLATWVSKYSISHTAVNELLKIFKTWPQNCLNDFPLDVRSLLHTPRRTIISPLNTGFYTHVGLKNGIIHQLEFCSLESPIIYVDIHIDGIPLWKSKKIELIPILGKIADPRFFDPFLIGAYYGDQKAPDIEKFLSQFEVEYNTLRNTGFDHNNKHYVVKIRAVIADTVARNWVMCHPNHNSYDACQKCEQKGSKKGGRMLLLDLDAPLKTDSTFRTNLSERFRNLSSPFERLGIGMVSQIPLDPMHLLYMGIMKKLLNIWSTEFGKGKAAQEINDLFSKDYIDLSSCVPSEFARKPRGLKELDHWKATEFRLFLLYLGPVAIKKYLHPSRIIHFNSLNCAIRILSDSHLHMRMNFYANQLLRHFVEEMKNCYGEESIIFNVHNLIHLAGDVKTFGPLEEFSAFPYENYLQILKRMVRNSNFPLAQIVRRLEERNEAIPPKINKNIYSNNFKLLKEKSVSSGLPRTLRNPHSFVKFETFQLSDEKFNNCCYLTDGIIVLIKYICFKNETPVIVGHCFEEYSSIPDYPIDSRYLQIYLVKKLSNNLQIWPITSIEKKGFQIPVGNDYYVFPILHSSFN